MIKYTYDPNGIRTSKTVNGVKHNYVLEGIKLLRDEYNGVDYLYDTEDQVCGMVYDGNAYYFYKNLQGDVIAITNARGIEIARYSYDAWGVCTILRWVIARQATAHIKTRAIYFPVILS